MNEATEYRLRREGKTPAVEAARLRAEADALDPRGGDGVCRCTRPLDECEVCYVDYSQSLATPIPAEPKGSVGIVTASAIARTYPIPETGSEDYASGFIDASLWIANAIEEWEASTPIPADVAELCERLAYWERENGAPIFGDARERLASLAAEVERLERIARSYIDDCLTERSRAKRSRDRERHAIDLLREAVAEAQALWGNEGFGDKGESDWTLNALALISGEQPPKEAAEAAREQAEAQRASLQREWEFDNRRAEAAEAERDRMKAALERIELISTNHGGDFENGAWAWGQRMGNIARAALNPPTKEGGR